MNNVVSLTRREKTPDDLLTFKEACKKFCVKYHYIYKWSVQEREIPCYGKRGFRAVRESDLVRFLEGRNNRWRA